MPQSYVQYRGNGTTVAFAVPFPYINKSHVGVKVDGIPAGAVWINDTTLSLTHAVPGDGVVVEVRRTTPNTQRLVDFVDGSTLTESDLDQNSIQFLYLSQEALDRADEAPRLTAQNTYDFQGRRATNAADPVGPQDVVTRAWAETAQASTLKQANDARADAIQAVSDARKAFYAAEDEADAAAVSAQEAKGAVAAAQGSAVASKVSADASANSAAASELSARRAEAAASSPAPSNPGSGSTGSVTAAQITDSSATGRALVTGTPAQGRTALDVEKLYSNVTVKPETALNWANHKRDHYDKLLVTVGNPSWYVWPGGGYSDSDMHYGNTSAVTGAMHIPLSADESRDATNNLIFISSGVMGLISTASHNAAAVGLYGKANAAVNQCRIWGFNVGCGNKLSDIPGEGEAYHTNQIGGEIDVAWQQPPASNPGNSNVFGLTIAGEFQGGRPLGECSGVEVFAYNGQPWKIAYGTGHGAADKFAQVALSKKVAVDGPSSSQQLEFIACASGAGSGNQLRYGYCALNSGGDFLFQPNYYGQPGSIIVANAALSQSTRISPSGIFAADATLAHLGVTGNADVSGNIAASGTVQGGAFNTPGTITGRDIVAANDIKANGNLIAQAALYAPNFFFFQGKQVGFAPEGNNIPPGYKALIVAV